MPFSSDQVAFSIQIRPNDSNRQTTSLLSSGTALVQNAADYIKLTTNTTKVTVLPMDVVQIID